MSKRAKKYSAITSMEELRNEKQKLHKQILVREIELRQDLRWIREKFSPANIMHELRSGIFEASGIVRSAVTGFRAIRSLFDGGGKRRSCGCGK